MANSITWAIQRFLRLDGRNDRGKAGPPSRHRGFTICRACSACHARARLARAQPPADLASLFLARAQPLLPLPPASQSRLPCTLQSLRRRHRRQFCSPQPWQLEGQQYTTTTTSHTPRWPAPSAPHGPAQPPFASPPVPPIKSHLSSSANAAAAPRQRPGRLADLQPAMPPPPHPLGSIS